MNMPGQILRVFFFRTETGNEPVRAWLRELSKESKKIVGEDIKTVQFGWPLGMPLVRKLEAGLWEVRSNIPDGITRVLFTIIEHDMILLHAFKKKSQKAPTRDLSLARFRLKQLQ